MGVALAPPETQPLDEALAELKELHTARRALIKDRTAQRNRQKIAQLALVKRQIAQRLAQIERQINAIDQEAIRRIQEIPRLRRRLEILVSMPGIAHVTALALLVEMPELGTLNAKQTASLAGLAPITRQSVAWRGKAHIRGGRATLRQALYMPALVAMRYNAQLKSKYQQLIKRGKPAKVAITAIMRKLITTANALIRDDRNWTENSA